MDLISVIVPVYNVINYLDKCIKSIIHQDYFALEIILVDDGSTDGSGELCDVYSKLDKRIIVCHKENGGLSDARNVGIRHASGKYITFVDSDDSIDNTYISFLHTLIVQENADLSICEFSYVDDKMHRINHPTDDGSVDVFNQKEAIVHLLRQKPYSNSPCGKMFKLLDFQDIEFPYGKLYEDTATVYKLFLKANKIVFGAKALYHYLFRVNSLSKQGFNQKQLQSAEHAETMVYDILKKYPDLLEEGICRLFDPYISLFKLIDKNTNPNEYDHIYSKIKTIRYTVLLYKNTSIKRRIYAAVSFASETVFRSIIKHI